MNAVPDFGVSPHDERLEPWAWSISQADPAGLEALEQRLHKRLALLRSREWSNDVERDALRLCAERREILIAEAASAAPPSAPSGFSAVQAAHAADAAGNGDTHDRFRW